MMREEIQREIKKKKIQSEIGVDGKKQIKGALRGVGTNWQMQEEHYKTALDQYNVVKL